MGRIARFEDIEAWQRARELTAQIYAVTRDGQFARDFGLKDQIRRASVSSMSNIAEGFERGNDNEFHRFLSIAKGSVGEVRSQLYVALDASYIDGPTFHQLYDRTNDISFLIGGFMQYLRPSH